MAKARARTQARKVRDKWKAKQWYTLTAPAMFNDAVLAETLADDPAKIVGRVVTTTMQELTGDFKQMHVKLDFQVSDVEGSSARTHFVGHQLTSDYSRRLVRRNHSKIDTQIDVTTTDGARVRAKTFAVSERRTQSSQQAELRLAMQGALTAAGAESTLSGFMREILDGRASTRLYKACKKLYPMRRIEIHRTQVLAQPAAPVENDVTAIAVPGAVPPPGETQADEAARQIAAREQGWQDEPEAKDEGPADAPAPDAEPSPDDSSAEEAGEETPTEPAEAPVDEEPEGSAQDPGASEAVAEDARNRKGSPQTDEPE